MGFVADKERDILVALDSVPMPAGVWSESMFGNDVRNPRCGATFWQPCDATAMRPRVNDFPAGRLDEASP
jgi:hypothetical protein